MALLLHSYYSPLRLSPSPSLPSSPFYIQSSGLPCSPFLSLRRYISEQFRQRGVAEKKGQQIEELSKQELLWRAAKLPIYSVALVPLSVGSAISFFKTGIFDANEYWLLLVSSVLVITWLNLSNDAYDAETGVDKEKKESVVNITGSQKGVLYAAYISLIVGFGGIAGGTLFSHDLRVFALLSLAILCGYVYQCPPFRLSYKGLGEPLCFLAFGPLATTAFYLSQSSMSGSGVLPVDETVLGSGVIVGATTTLILFCSHFHQIEGDAAVGKMSPLVKLGTQRASNFVSYAVAGLYTFVSVLTVSKALPIPCGFFSLLTLPLGKVVTDFVSGNHSDKTNIFKAKYYCVRLHVAFGTALTLGLLAARLLPH